MGEIISRALGVLRRWPVLLVFLLLAGGGAALVMVPLLGLPGYELSAALAVGQGLLGGVAGIAAARQERRMIQGIDPRPKGSTRSDSSLVSMLRAVGAALLFNVLTLVPPLFFSVGYALASTRCDPFAAFGFFPWLTLPSALMAAALGVFVGLASRRALVSALLYLVGVLVFAGFTAFPLLTGPQVYAFNHLGGYLPGPLYDEAIRPGAPLYWFRLETLLWAAVVLVFTALMLDMKTGQLTRPHLRVGAAVLLGALGFGIFALEERAPALGIRMTDSALHEKLGGRRESEHVELIYPRGKPKADVERFLNELEFRHAQVSAFLGATPEGKVRVVWYRSAAEKQSLVGAGGTQFAKPWRREVHVNDAPFPHPVVKHELVHAMAAPFGARPFGVTATVFGLFPHAGLIEGLAVAADEPVDDLTLHQWAAGMKAEKLLPDLRELMKPTGFYASAASRSYSAAGSFVHWLGERHGGEKLRQLYAHGDFQGVYGQSLDALASEWETFLDAVPLEPEARAQAFGRFRRGSLFQRPCAREVATLQHEGAEVLPSDPDLAVTKFARCAELQPDEPGHVLNQARALEKAGRAGEAAEALRRLLPTVEDKPAVAAELAMGAADVAVKRGFADEAKGLLEKILALAPSPAMDRTARVKLHALAHPTAGPALWAYFEDGQEDVKLLRLREALEAVPEDPYLSYLLGRRLTQSREGALALPYLKRTLSFEGLPESIRLEALRLRAEAGYLANDCGDVAATVGLAPSASEAWKAKLFEWQQRCEFDARKPKGN